jgi:hypothetical protein
MFYFFERDYIHIGLLLLFCLSFKMILYKLKYIIIAHVKHLSSMVEFIYRTFFSRK